MYVCLCQAVSDKSVRKAISEGATTVREIQRRCNAGKNCGGCLHALRYLIDEEFGKREPSQASKLESKDS